LAELDRLRAARPRLPAALAAVKSASRLRWIADRMDEAAARTDDGRGTDEPVVEAPDAPGTPQTVAAPPLPAAAEPLNRAQRRRLAALERLRAKRQP
jgi:hypothetical protein